MMFVGIPAICGDFPFIVFSLGFPSEISNIGVRLVVAPAGITGLKLDRHHVPSWWSSGCLMVVMELFTNLGETAYALQRSYSAKLGSRYFTAQESKAFIHPAILLEYSFHISTPLAMKGYAGGYGVRYSSCSDAKLGMKFTGWPWVSHNLSTLPISLCEDKFIY